MSKMSRLSKNQKKIAYRRQAVFSLLVQGITNQYEIAERLHISQATCSRDLQFLNSKFSEEMKLHIHDLPLNYKICSTGISEVLRFAWSLLYDKNSKVNRTAVLSLIEQCYKDRLEMVTNAAVISQALSELDSMKQQILASGNNSKLLTQ